MPGFRVCLVLSSLNSEEKDTAQATTFTLRCSVACKRSVAVLMVVSISENLHGDSRAL